MRPPLSVKILYAFGQLGWSLAAFGAFNLLVYFYMPPGEGSDAIFPTFIYQGAVVGILTIIGILSSGGRIFDAFTDPLIANWSDKSTSSFGKRKKLMAVAIVPFTLLSFLIFYPIGSSIIVNGIWLFATIFLFYLFMTMYVVPYTALISELGHHPDDRMLISTLISVTWALGFIIGQSAYPLQSHFEKTMDSVSAFQMAIGIFAIVSFVFMLIPLLFLNENKYCKQQVTEQNMGKALLSVFSNKNFKFFAISDLMYWLSLTFIQMGMGFYVTIIFDMDKSYAFQFASLGFVLSFLFYIPINFLVKRFGKKPVISIAFIVFSIIFGMIFLIDSLPLPKLTLFYILAALSAFPLAAFGIIPNAIVADVIHEHEQKTGESQSGMFYAARNLMMKLGISLANLIFPSLLLLGKSVNNPAGVKASALCAVIFCVVGYLFFLKYEDVAEQ